MRIYMHIYIREHHENIHAKSNKSYSKVHIKLYSVTRENVTSKLNNYRKSWKQAQGLLFYATAPTFPYNHSYFTLLNNPPKYTNSSHLSPKFLTILTIPPILYLHDINLYKPLYSIYRIDISTRYILPLQVLSILNFRTFHISTRYI